MSVNVKLLGDKKLDKKLKELESRTQKKVVRKAMRNTAKAVQKDVRSAAPVASGRLRKSIKVRASKRSRRRIGIEVRTGERSELGIEPSERGYYPASIEFGSRPHQIEDVVIDGEPRKVVTHPGTRPNPFIRGTMDRKRRQYLRKLAREIGRGIEGLAK